MLLSFNLFGLKWTSFCSPCKVWSYPICVIPRLRQNAMGSAEQDPQPGGRRGGNPGWVGKQRNRAHFLGKWYVDFSEYVKTVL